MAIALSAAVIAGSPSAKLEPYPVHRNVTATVFWIGEPVGDGSTENNAISAYDDRWLAHYGGTDDAGYVRNYPYFPRFAPHENPFYIDLPYDDFLNSGDARPGRESDVPWANTAEAEIVAAARHQRPYSLMKNRWVKLSHAQNGTIRTCYGQIEDAGPYVYNDARYVFGSGDVAPANRRAHNAGLDVSPALRDCLGFRGLDNDSNRVSWQFANETELPAGPWRRVVTTRQVFWP